jgi:integrase
MRGKNRISIAFFSGGARTLTRSATRRRTAAKWSVSVNPAGLAKHYLTPAVAALGLAHTRWHDLRHAFAVMSLSAGEHYMAVSKMLGHASYVTTLTVYADEITESDGDY